MIEALQLVRAAVGAYWAPVVAFCFSFATRFARCLRPIATEARPGSWRARIHDLKRSGEKVDESVRAAVTRQPDWRGGGTLARGDSQPCSLRQVRCRVRFDLNEAT